MFLMSETGWLNRPGENRGEGEEEKEVGKEDLEPPRSEDVAPVVEGGRVLDKEVDGDHHNQGARVD